MTNPWIYNDGYNYHQVPYSYNRMGDTPELPASFIDPSLQSLSPTSVYPTTMDQHQSMQRQVKEEQKTMFFNSSNSPQATFVPSTMGASFQLRYTSPFSAFEASEASGTAQSPPADTNTEPPTYFESRSPLQEPLPYEDFGLPQNHYLQFAGLGLINNDSFVNPMDVNSTGQLDGYDSESNTSEFVLPQRVNSWASYTTGCMAVSGCDMETIQQQQQPQHNSPIVDYTKPYPPTPEVKVEQSPIALPLNLKRTRTAADADDDDDYLPAVKRTAPSTITKPRNPGTTRRGRPPTSQSAIIHRPHQPTRTFPSTTKPLHPTSKSPLLLLCPHPPCIESHSQHGFKDQPSLDAHIKKAHSRPFICVFSFAGCDSTFGSKNEWKRHVASQHLVLEYWLCREGECANVDNNTPTLATTASASSRGGRRGGGAASVMVPDEEDNDNDAPLLPNGAIFNRKDLYTQHVRRMHLPAHLKSTSPCSSSSSTNKKPSAALLTDQTTEINTLITTLQSRASIKRCSLPTYMRCPVRSCHQEFKGTEAWDTRMEHVAKHLEKYAAFTFTVTPSGGSTAGSSPPSAHTERNGTGEEEEEEEDRVEFGGEHDTSLTGWASSREVGIIKRVGGGRNGGGRWVMRDPIKRRGHGGNAAGSGCGPGPGRGGRSGRQQRRAAKVEAEELHVKQEIVVQMKEQIFDFDDGEDVEENNE